MDSIDTTCVKCSQTLQAWMAFCPKCGTPSEKPKTPPLAAATNVARNVDIKPNVASKAAGNKPCAEQRKIEAMAARLSEWLVYSPGEDLGSWLDNNKPSVIKREDHVGWIAIFNNNLDDQASRSGDMDKLMGKWETIKSAAAEPGSRIKINFESIRELARDCGFVAGKWLFHVPTGATVDEAWRKVCKEMINDGLLTNVVTSAKVSPFDTSMVANSHHVISTHGRDYSDFAEVCRHEKALRATGVTADMRYKPDIYSHLGIYANNEWKIKPTIYSSQYDRIRKQSKVIETFRDNRTAQPANGRRSFAQSSRPRPVFGQPAHSKPLAGNPQSRLFQKPATFSSPTPLSNTSTIFQAPSAFNTKRVNIAIDALADKWIVYSHDEDLDIWLDANRPSIIKRADHVGWIAINNKAADQANRRKGDKEKLLKNWETMKKAAAQPGSSIRINFETISNLAVECNFTHGKWMFHAYTGYIVDKAWRKVCKQMVNDGLLTKEATSVRVSPFERRFDNFKHVISAENRDFLDYDQVCRLEKALRAVGIMDDLSYKPDVYSHLGIYSQNEWGVRPSIYSSRYDVISQQSIVTKTI